RRRIEGGVGPDCEGPADCDRPARGLRAASTGGQVVEGRGSDALRACRVERERTGGRGERSGVAEVPTHTVAERGRVERRPRSDREVPVQGESGSSCGRNSSALI